MLPLALLVIALMALAARAFVDLMNVEAMAATRGVERRQLRLAAESGIEYVAAMLDARNTSWKASDFSEGRAAARGESGSDIRFEFGRHTPVRALREDNFPVVDESSKLNLLSLSLKPDQRRESRTRLMALPGMNESIAEAILDWMDADDTPSTHGAESGWYASQKDRALPAQRPLETLEELLLVRVSHRGCCTVATTNRLATNRASRRSPAPAHRGGSI